MVQKFCFVKDQNGGFHKVLFEEILYVKSLGNYLQVVTSKGALVTLGSLLSMEEELGSCGHFARIHKSYIVNLEQVEQLSADGIQVGGHNLPVGAKFMDAIKKDYIYAFLLKL